MKPDAKLTIFFFILAVVSCEHHRSSQISLGPRNLNPQVNYLQASSENKDSSSFLRTTRKSISQIIEGFNPSNERFKQIEKSHKHESLVDTRGLPHNLTFATTTSEVYFIQKKIKRNKNQDVLINITNDEANKQLSMDVNYDNNTKVIIDDKKIYFDKNVTNQQNQQNQINTTNSGQVNTTDNSGFLKTKLQNQGNKIVKDSVVDCSNSNNTSSAQSVCSLCNSPYAYVLNDDNWYKIGLINSQRKGYSDFLNTLSNTLKNSTFLIAFSDEAICVTSDQIAPGLSLNDITTEYTQRPITDFELYDKIFEINTLNNSLFFQIKYLLNVERYENFKFVYQPITSYSLNKIIELTPQKVTLYGDNDTVLITGAIDLNKTFFYSFYHSYKYLEKNPDSLVFSVGELPAEQQNSLEIFFLKFFGPTLTQGLLDELTISRGLHDLSKLRIKGIVLRPYLDGPKKGLTILNLQIAYVPNFSISPEFLLYDCFGDYLIFLQGDPLAFTWRFVVDCACKRFENLARLYILRSEGSENIFLNATRQNLTLKEIEEKLFETGVQKIKGSTTTGFFSEMKAQTDMQKYQNVLVKLKLEQGNIDDFSTEIFFSPQLTYRVSGTFYIPDLYLQGKLNAIISNIGGVMSSVVHLEFSNITPEKLIKNFIDRNTLMGLESLSEIIIPKSVVLMTASRDVDLKNFAFVKTKNIYNESFWERGVHLSFDFSLSLECQNNRFCEYMAHKYDPNYVYSLYGELSEQESLNLVGKPQFIDGKVQPINFTPKKVKLNIPLIASQTHNNESGIPLINFQLVGEFILDVENNKTLRFNSEISFSNIIRLTGNSENIWSSGLDLSALNLTQLAIRGQISTETYFLNTLDLGSLAIFGRECLLQTLNESLFQKSRCFYGNVEVTADYQDYHNNYLEGYFPNANIWNILFSSLDYDDFRQYDVVSKHISNIKILNGVDLVYATQEIKINTLRFKNRTQVVEERTIPAGFTIKGLASVVGCDGVLVLNIQPVEQQFNGVFYLTSAVSFAGGNGIILQTDLNSTEVENSVIFNMKGNAISQEKQVNFIGKINIFNIQSLVDMSITNEEYLIQTSGNIFDGLYNFSLELRAPYNEKLVDAPFIAKGMFSSELIRDLELGLRNRTIEWMNYVKFILDRLDTKITELKLILDVKQTELCNEELCPKELQCVDEPHQQCLEYSQKTVCIKEESFCLKPEQTCTKEQKVCVSEEKTCISIDEKTNACAEYKTECLDYITICSEWKHVCNSDTVMACIEFDVQQDNNICKRSEFICKIEEIRDVICQNDCMLRKKQYEKYERLYANLLSAKEMFNRKLTGFWIMSDEINKKPEEFLGILQGSFQENMSALIDPRNITMRLSIVSFKEDLKINENLEIFEENNFDFHDLDNFIHGIFMKLSKKWSERFKFDMILLKENEADLLNSLFIKVQEQVGQSFTTALIGNIFE